ncbi:MAG TPA: hypothetical protein VLH60_05825 [Sedimentisphaerales bacterium]|nr:hypothetical protein [Sedimentisphaerales bacterium]
MGIFLLIALGVIFLAVILARVLCDRPEQNGVPESQEKERLLAALSKGETTPEEVIKALAATADKAKVHGFWSSHVYELWIFGGLLLAAGGAMAGAQPLLGGVLAVMCLVLPPMFIVPKGCEGRAALCIMFLCLMSVILIMYALLEANWNGIGWGASAVILGFAFAFFAALLRGQAYYARRE